MFTYMFNNAEKIVATFTIIGILGTAIFKAYTWVEAVIKRPKITWGIHDLPSSKRADYFLKVHTNTPLENIKIVVRPRTMQPSDYTIKVRTFLEPLGHEHMCEIKAREAYDNDKDTKSIEFDILKSGLYRIIVTSGGGYSGSYLPQNCEVILNHNNAKISYQNGEFFRCSIFKRMNSWFF